MNDILTTEANPAARLSDLRARVLAGDDVTAEEYADVLAIIRKARTAAPEAGSKARAKKVVATAIEAGNLFAAFE